MFSLQLGKDTRHTDTRGGKPQLVKTKTVKMGCATLGSVPDYIRRTIAAPGCCFALTEQEFHVERGDQLPLEASRVVKESAALPWLESSEAGDRYPS